ncbi:uncharacterized protein LOC110372648 [Helicoverpa armigera]|uniref:uncharacterized protein LOC110372648 n=1 Tax=Helicoverpa armigera TaxID=29058 RepID=UPI003082FD68
MNFLDLPVEVGVIIFNYLDTKTKIDVYNSSVHIREYFASGWCHLKNVILSRSTLATVKTLNDKLFVNLAEHISCLNLSGVQDLTVQNLKPHISRFVNLKSLDLTFTNIYLSDIGEVCPKTVRNIGINFFKCPSSYKNERINEKCREIFKERQFKAIHFVIFEFIVSASPLKFLNGVPLVQDLKLTVSDNYKDFFDLSHHETSYSNPYEIETNFSKLTYLFRDCAVTHKMSAQLDGISRLNFNQLEYIFVMYLEKIAIYVSPIFSSIFPIQNYMNHCNDFKLEISSYLPQNFMLDGNIIFKAWNKATTTFDDVFFKKLMLELKDYFPTYICMHNQTKMQIVKGPSNWYCIDSCENFEKKLDYVPEMVTLTDFCRRDGVVMRCRRPISLCKESKTIRHLTFLRINNIPLRKDFFTHLFTACPKLVTLDIYVEKHGMIRGYTQSLSKAIHLAKLKNFMLTSEDVEYEIIFEILSHCISLENVHICEYERAANDDEVVTANIVKFIEQCVNLYSLFIEADMSGEGLTMLMAPLRVTAQTLERNHLCIEVCESYCGWNPFVDVFNPSPLHILN